VKKRDGRRVPFDARKLAASIEAAARAAGEEGVLADELAEVVALFLERDFRERIPETRDLEDLVARVLLETGHARAAAVYQERLKLRDRRREEISVVREGEPPVGPDGELLPEPPPEPWNEGRIVAALERRCRLSPEVAEEVAGAVEAKIFALGLKRVPARLVRELIDAELGERGFSARLGRRGDISVPAEEVRRLLVAWSVRRGSGDDPVRGGPEEAVGVDVLTRFALSDLYPEHVAEASREGRIHIQDIGRPLRLASGAVSIEALKARAGRDAPRSAAELGVALARLLARAARFHARALGIPCANVFLAPFARGKKEAAIRRDLREFLRLLPAGHGPPPLVLHLGRAPEAIEALPAIGPGGRRWRACYGELRPEADRTARLLIEIAAEEAARGAPLPRLALEVSDRASLDLARPPVDLVLAGPGLRPEASRGLAEGAALAAALAHGGVLAAGAAQIVAINCAAAAYRAGRGNDPAFRRELDLALDLALEAIRAKWSFLEAGLYRPRLPLWEAGAAAEEPPIVAAERAVHAIGLIGLDEAYIFLAGEPPAQNPAVARLAGEAIAALGERARREGARRGLAVRIEDPDLSWASRRLADLDLRSTPAAREVLGLERAANEVRYTSGFGAAPALFEAIYRPLGIAPYVASGEGARARAEALLAVAALFPPAPIPPPEPAPAPQGAIA
jgi:ribonucleoside-triphosphate reductase